MKVRCAHCAQWVQKERSAVNRARKVGMQQFCNRRCFGLSRRSYKRKAEKVAAKRLYDIQYRRNNRTRLQAAKHAYFERTYDPIEAAKARRARMHLHVAYCRRPEYKRWKQRYDQRHCAHKTYGPYAEPFLVLLKIESEIASRITNYEVRQTNGTLNKTQQRKRAYSRFIGDESKNGPVGNSTGHQRRPDATCAG